MHHLHQDILLTASDSLDDDLTCKETKKETSLCLKVESVFSVCTKRVSLPFPDVLSRFFREQ